MCPERLQERFRHGIQPSMNCQYASMQRITMTQLNTMVTLPWVPNLSPAQKEENPSENIWLQGSVNASHVGTRANTISQ